MKKKRKKAGEARRIQRSAHSMGLVHSKARSVKECLDALASHWGLETLTRREALAKLDGREVRTPAPRKKKPSAAFYSSWEWKRLRYEALRLHGHRCQCCGWRPGDTEHGYLVVDHIKPRSARPDLELRLDNLQVLCNDCNMGKSNVFEDDFRQIHRATIQ